MARRNLSAVGIVNAIVQNVNQKADVNLPFVTKQSFSDFGKQLSYSPEEVKNAFYDGLVNVAGLQILLGKKSYESPFRKLYKEEVVTDNLELMMVDAIRAKAYDPNDTQRVLETEPPRIGVQFIQSVIRNQYQLTDCEELFRNAFTNEGSFMSALDALTVSLYSSMEDDMYIVMKELLNKNVDEGNIKLYPVQKPQNQAGLLNFMANVKKIGSDWNFRSREYNVAGYRTYSPDEDHYFLVDTELDSLNSVFNIPWAFRGDYLSLRQEGEAVLMDSSCLHGGQVYSILFDRDFIQVHPRAGFPRFTNFFNPATLTNNRFLTVYSLMSISLFSNAVAFCDPNAIGFDSTTPATIATRDGASAYNKGMIAEVYVSEVKADTGKICDKFGKWSVSGATDSTTYIDEDSGELFIGNSELGTQDPGDSKYYLVVTWTSHLDSSVYVTKSIEINH